jgi:diguanylate cyclase (GGDEF)-like protein/PAS domain S-box-containing protein
MMRVWSCLETQHDWWLVSLAACVCYLTSFGAATLLQRARSVASKARVAWLMIAGLVTGGGVWATHFIGMLAYSPGFPLQYDLAITAFSLVAAVAIITAGFAQALYGGPRWGALIGGATVGVGIVCMHFIGMASLRIPAMIVWLPDLVTASIMLAVAFCCAALWFAEHGKGAGKATWTACLLTLAIFGHHFVAMSAIGLVRVSTSNDAPPTMSPVVLSIAVAALAAAIVAAALIGAVVDRRNRLMTDVRNMQLDTALNNMAQGLCMFGPDGALQLWNESYLNLYGIAADRVVAGMKIEQLFELHRAIGMEIKDIEKHSSELKRAIKGRTAASLNKELSDGRTIHVTYRPMSNGGWVTTHEDITERKATEARIAFLALHDPVTGLPNRASFYAHLRETVGQARAQQNSFALARIDIDHLKEVNDVFGQAAGDAVLCAFARKLEETCNCGFLARPGGDEFVIVSFAGAATHPGEQIFAQLSGMLDNEFKYNDKLIQIGCTIGVSIYPQDGTDAETLIANADAALYRAKCGDRGTIRFFEAAMDRQVRERRSLRRDLAVALEQGQFELYYQPQSTTDGDLVAFEALLRWHHPERGMVSPSVFIPIAEETGLIWAIDEWVLRNACREAASWPKHISVAVNLSPVDFQTGDVPDMLMTVLLETGLNPKRLEIEITEGVLIVDFARAITLLRRIKNLGVRVAMDDFGTGYSSLSYLQSFPFDKIKIDRTFIGKLENNPQTAAIIHAIIGLGRSLKLPVIAEGVENKAQLDFLAAEGCAEIQGYLMGQPQPIAYYQNVIDGDAVNVSLRQTG